MMRRIVFVLVSLVCSGCLRSTTAITVRADGTGTILQETAMSAQTLSMLQSVAADPKLGGPPQLFGPEQAKKAADAMGVRFVSGEPFKNGQLEGYRAQYAFDDIGKIRFNMNQDQVSGLAGKSESKEPPFGFDFERRASSSVLTIRMPEQKPGTGGPLGPLAGGRGAQSADMQNNPQALAMMKMMLQGLFVDVSLTVDGRVVKTNAPYVDGSRITLMQLDFDKLLADEGAFQRLQGATDVKAIANIPGIKVVAEPKLTIEFAR